MKEEISKILEIDEIAENGVYCIAPSNEDLQMFAEHARKRKKDKKNTCHVLPIQVAPIPKLPRCKWCNIANPVYVRYHDEEWGVPCHNDHDLYELLLLESFQAGLSWETILNKREHFREAYDGFDIDKVCSYGDDKIALLLSDKGIIRNQRKINASIKNSRIFREIQREYGSFDKYIWSWTDGKIIYESDQSVTISPLSDVISSDLKKRGMSFVGSTIIYAYLQAIGVINAHSEDCYLHK